MNVLSRLARFMMYFLVLLGAWLLLSGKFDWFHVAWGLLTSLVLAAGVTAWPRRGGFPFLRFFAFLPWHLCQVFVSNLRVARLALSPGMPIRPRLLRPTPGLADPRAQTLLGCSITLTPGTLTVDVDEKHMIVHALDDASAADVDAEVMQRKVHSVFEGVGR